jgi:hypothetical protein
MNWITDELLKRHGFRPYKTRIDKGLRKLIFSPLGDPQFLRCVDPTNGVFEISRYPDHDNADLNDAVFIEISNETELTEVIRIFGKP